MCILTSVSESGESVGLAYSSPSSTAHGKLSREQKEITLLEYTKSMGRIDENEAKLLFGQLTLALAGCHERLVIHRDLKLPSILINPETGIIRIADFSHSSAINRASEPMGDRRGSPAYVSPEILVSKTYSGQAADCWSLGVILYAMLCGVFPFAAQTPQLLFDKIMRAEPAYPDHLSAQACSLLRGLLKPTPSTRLTTADALDHPWLSMSSEEDQMVPDMEE